MLDWNTHLAAIWRQRQAYLRPVRQLDTICLQDLIGIDAQKQRLVHNTQRFLVGQPENTALLWGARGTGKSSLVKAILNEFHPQGLRIVEVDKQDLVFLPEIVDSIRELPQRFVVYCDDLSFSSDDSHYKSLKSVLEGSIESRPENILLYATSNSLHLLPEKMSENLETVLVGDELHYPDAIEEKISLSDRFGLWLAFYPQPMPTYLEIVDSYFKDYAGDRAELHHAALEFAHLRGARSGRTAKQFYNSFVELEP